MHSQKYSNVMHFKVFILFHLLYFINGEAIADISEHVSINNISDVLFSLINTEDNDRIHELKNKLKSINKYVIDNEEMNKVVMNVTKETLLNETEFYKSLNDNDYFRFIAQKEPTNLYLKLKENVNRNDVMDMLKKNGKSKVLKSARKNMPDEYLGRGDKYIVNDIVDKMIAESPTDDHNFKATINDSIYWDPQNELEDLRDYHKHDGRRIYKGERTTVRYYPFMVSVHVMGRFWCGGVIYWHDLVLTSASCLQLMHNNRFFRENPRVLQVRAGSNHSRVGGETIDALEVYFHPGYNPKSLKNNIALIRLRRHLYFNYHRMPKIIDISHNEDGLPATAEVLLLGWGVTKMSQKMSYEPIYLQRKFLPVYPNKFCKEIYGDKFISQKMFCAGTLTTGEGACDHDAGGPAVLSGKLVGIISFGPTICGFPNVPTVFTLVGAYADWIETVNETMPSYYRGRIRTTSTTPSPLLDLLDHWPGAISNTRLYEAHASPVATTQSAVPFAEEETTNPTTTEKIVKRMRDDNTDEGWSIGD